MGSDNEWFQQSETENTSIVVFDAQKAPFAWYQEEIEKREEKANKA